MKIRTLAAAALCLLAIIGWSHPSRAVTAADITDETYSTFFNDLAPTIGGQGMPYAPTPAQNPIGTVATFGAPGIVSFMNNPPYYIFPTSPLSLGFAGAGTMDITFSTAMDRVSIGVRGTRFGTVTGPLASGNPFPADLALVDAVGKVSALDHYGNVIAGSTTPIENLDMALVAEITFTTLGLGAEIHGLRFRQRIYSRAAGLMVGGLGLTPIPEPGTGVLGGLGLIGWLLASRRSSWSSEEVDRLPDREQLGSFGSRGSGAVHEEVVGTAVA